MLLRSFYSSSIIKPCPTLYIFLSNNLFHSEISHMTANYLQQGCTTLKGHCPADLSYNPNQTLLNELIKCYKITKNLLTRVFLVIYLSARVFLVISFLVRVISYQLFCLSFSFTIKQGEAVMVTSKNKI